MKKCSSDYFIIKTTMAIVAIAMALLAPAPAHASLPANTAGFHGGNWSSTGLIGDTTMYPYGITSSTTPAEATNVALTAACDFKAVGINFVRFPVNPCTVNGADGGPENWAVSQACINELVAQGLNVDICCWYIDQTNGQIPDGGLWEAMWQTIDGVYGGNTNVYYEPINEPWGYTPESKLSDDVYQFFLNDYGITKPKDHIILDCGFNNQVPISSLYNDANLDGCFLTTHPYASGTFGGNRSVYGQETNLEAQIGNSTIAKRVMMTECGACTLNGLDYNDTSSTDSNVCFVQSLVTVCSTTWPMGFTWFPAYQAPDLSGVLNQKTMFNAPGEGVLNPSLFPQLQSGWGRNAVWSSSWDNPASGSGFTTAFGACSWGSEREDVFGVKSDGNIYHTWYFNGSGWNAWEEHQCTMAPTNAPAASANNAVANREDLYYIGADGNLYHQYYDGAWEPSGLNSWDNIGAPAGVTLVGSPSATSWSAGRYDVYARGTDSTVYHAYSTDGTTWYWTDQGGSTTIDVASCSWGANRLDGFAIGTGSSPIYHQYYDGSWHPSGTTWAQNTPETNTTYALGACCWSTNRIDLFDNNGSTIGHAWYDFATTGGSPAWGGTWTQTFSPPTGVTFVSAPCATSWGVNRLDVFVLGSDGKCYHLYWGI